MITGEEDDDTIYQVRGKLFALSSQNQWQERGTGTLRLNVRRSDGAGARLSELSTRLNLLACCALLTRVFVSSHAEGGSVHRPAERDFVQRDARVARAGPAVRPVQRARVGHHDALQSPRTSSLASAH